MPALDEIVRKYEDLLYLYNMEVDQFNEGFDAAIKGLDESTEPHYEFDTDNWILGYAFGLYYAKNNMERK